MVRKKTDEDRIKTLKSEIRTIEKRREIDLIKIQEKKKKLEELEASLVMKEIKAYQVSPAQLKELLSKHVKPTEAEADATYPVVNNPHNASH